MSDKEILIKVEGVSKKFCKDLKTSLKYGMFDLTAQIFGKKQNKELRDKEFWAVKDVSFELRRGDALGLIGHNGAGKSTLLKMLNGLIKPDEGSIEMRGRIAALIELGAGFNPVLTGRENIYNNGVMLGFTKSEIDNKIDEIIAFSELDDFIDTPVKSYSSGMKVRLGFSVAAQLEPDVLILDEVLAVGDVGFKGKSLKVIGEMINNAAVILVSHSMPVINRYCNKGILLDKGKISIINDNIQVPINAYLKSFESNKNSNKFSTGDIELEQFSIGGTDMLKDECQLNLFDHSIFSFKISRKNKKVDNIIIRLNFINNDLVIIASLISDKIFFDSEQISYKVNVGPFNMQPGNYKISLVVFRDDFTNPLLIHDSVYEFEVIGDNDYGGNYLILEKNTVNDIPNT